MNHETECAEISRENTGAVNLEKQYGSTVYLVSIHFSQTSSETLEDKILRLIEREVIDLARSPMCH